MERRAWPERFGGAGTTEAAVGSVFFEVFEVRIDEFDFLRSAALSHLLPSALLSHNRHDTPVTGSSQVRGPKPRGASVEEAEAEATARGAAAAACRRRRRRPMPLKEEELARRLDTALLLRLSSMRGTEHEADAPEMARFIVTRTGGETERERREVGEERERIDEGEKEWKKKEGQKKERERWFTLFFFLVKQTKLSEESLSLPRASARKPPPPIPPPLSRISSPLWQPEEEFFPSLRGRDSRGS